MKLIRKTTLRGMGATLVVGLAATLGACASSEAPAQEVDTSEAKGELTYWGWTPGIEPMLEEFTRVHPDITVKQVNVGNGAPHYSKLRTAIKAGSGVPDVVMMEMQYIPTFANDLLDLNEYGAGDVTDGIVPFALGQVTRGDAVLGLPTDTGPMGLVYRKSILDEHGIEVPKTWDEFADAARKLHAADPDVYLTNIAPNNAGQILALTAQAGSRPYTLTGEAELTVAADDAGALRWAEFWGPLIDEGVISTDSDFTDPWYKGLADGRYASWITAAWGPVFLQGVVGETAGDWRAAPLPQWHSGDEISANWGGSTVAVPKLAPNKAAAAEFAKWYATSDFAVNYRIEHLSSFPAMRHALEDPAFIEAEVPFFGGQQIAKEVFIPASGQIDPDFGYPPFLDYVFSQMQTELGQAMEQGSGLPEAFERLQDTVVGYATDQGFTVSAD